MRTIVPVVDSEECSHHRSQDAVSVGTMSDVLTRAAEPPSRRTLEAGPSRGRLLLAAVIGALVVVLVGQASALVATKVQARPPWVIRTAYGEGYHAVSVNGWTSERYCRIAGLGRYPQTSDGHAPFDQMAYVAGCVDAVLGHPNDPGDPRGD
jgi:hypothetical protein